MNDNERADRATELLRRFFEEFKGPDNMSDDSQICREIEAFLNPVPDFYEPWRCDGELIKNRISGVSVASSCSEGIQARIIACVNACKGMRDPAAEIAALREQAKAESADEDDFPPLIPPVSAMPKVKESWRCVTMDEDGDVFFSSRYGYREDADAELKTTTRPHPLGVFSASEFVAWMMSRK